MLDRFSLEYRNGRWRIIARATQTDDGALCIASCASPAIATLVLKALATGKPK
jgi:hypothetical protein